MSHATSLSASPNGSTMKRARPLLGTLVEIGARGASQQAVNSAITRAFAAVEQIQALMSFHDPDSDVSRLNRAGAAAISVHPHTWAVLETARAISQASEGLFDISVAPELVRRGYLPQHTDLALPDAAANWQDIMLLPDHRVYFTRPLHLDLGGIAKGYAVDCAIRTLRDAGMHSGRVNAGGDLRLFGETPETIHVRHPDAATQLLPLCQLQDGAIATSAPYYAGRLVDGQTLSPLIDTRTGKPCSGVRSISVLADSCMVADALTKVVFANAERSLAALRHFGAHAVVTDADPDLRVRLSEPGGWRDTYLLQPEAFAA